jgi:hypothetical protein
MALPCGADSSEVGFTGLLADELESAADPEVSWLWDGYLASRHVTLLTSQWKSGKTTLVSVLLSKLKDGGTFAGQALRPGRAVVVSEEPVARWLRRKSQLGFGPVRFFCRPFRGRPSPAQWQALIEHLRALHDREPFDLVVIDSLARFFPGNSENHATVMLDVLLPLGRLSETGASVLLLHHPRRKESPVGQAARRSGALQGHVDVIVEMRACVPAGVPSRRRRLAALSYFEETPPDRVIELTADGTDYTCVGDFEATAFAEQWAVLHSVLERATKVLTAAEILQDWPPQEARPAPPTLWRWLTRAAAEGRVQRQGAGHRSDPYRYCLTGMPERWERQRQEEIAAMKRGDYTLPGAPPAKPFDPEAEMEETMRKAFVKERQWLWEMGLPPPRAHAATKKKAGAPAAATMKARKSTEA